MLVEYEPLLATHIKGHANEGTGHVNYLSSTICEELIQLMGERVLNEIITGIRDSKYFSVSVDSTPNEAHIDHLTIVIRYMEKSMPNERFLSFLPNIGNTGDATSKALLQFLDNYNINIHDCRGQSYNNALNMSGKYKGMLFISLTSLKIYIYFLPRVQSDMVF